MEPTLIGPFSDFSLVLSTLEASVRKIDQIGGNEKRVGHTLRGDKWTAINKNWNISQNQKHPSFDLLDMIRTLNIDLATSKG